MRMHIPPHFLTGLLLGAISGGLLVYLLTPSVIPRISGAGALRESMTNYRYIDPLLACNAPEGTTGKYKELEQQLGRIIDSEITYKKANDISLYFQEYPSGRWVGIGENNTYNPASLLKIVLMIAYFKDEELHPGTLEKMHLYSASISNVNEAIPNSSTSSLVIGKSYSAESLIRAMIIDSDNGAKDVLLNDVNDAVLSQVYHDLKIPDPAQEKGEYKISPKEYSLFFRIIYNSTYLRRELSEKAMGILAESNYPDGITAGLPKNIAVAHKFGEHVNEEGGVVRSIELHDCGVVYGPNLPYFLCVMTTGSDISGLQSSIQDISRAVFNSVDINLSKNP